MRQITGHPVLLGFAATAAVALAVYGLGTGASLTVPYLVIVFGLGALVLSLDRRVHFSDVVAVGLTAWAIAHLAGGLIQLDGVAGALVYRRLSASTRDPHEPAPFAN